jgi:hypothetical protein
MQDPESITSTITATEYGLHGSEISTSINFEDRGEEIMLESADTNQDVLVSEKKYLSPDPESQCDIRIIHVFKAYLKINKALRQR